MKLEKVSDNQIRCTLTQQDLANRHLKLSELAYGTEKAKLLFHEMMQQASYELGFETDDIPLMIEAVPLSSEAIILIVTKVEYPEELDTRFSKFSDMPDSYDSFSDMGAKDLFSEGADDILDLFRKISEKKQTASNDVSLDGQPIESVSPAETTDELNVPIDLSKMFVFYDLSDLIRLAHILKGFYDGDNSLFKEDGVHAYYLILHKSHLSPEVFNKVCNILAEYANQMVITPSTEAYFTEHHRILCHHNALQSFALL